MPPRVARGSISTAAPKNARKKSQKRTLDAFSIASHQVPDRLKIKQHRLGESESHEPRQKRRRLEDDEEDSADEEHASNARRLQGKAVTKRVGGRAGGLDEEEDVGSDSEGNEWRMGGEIGEESDSSIDSDEAFGSSDEDRFEGFTFRGGAGFKSGGKTQKKKKGKVAEEMDLDEDEEEEMEDDFGDEGVDLATMLDDSGSEEEDDTKGKRRPRRGEISEEDDLSDEDDDDDDDDDGTSDTSMSEPESDADDADPEKLSKLEDLITSLDADLPDKAKRARSSDVHESQDPSDFGLTSSQKLKVSDLLPTVTDPALRKSLKVLASDKPSKRSGIPGKLAAPLPKRQQDRIDRVAANQKAKETLERWRDTVIQNRRAEHLQFPLIDPKAQETPGTNQLVSTQQDKPQTDLEIAINNILEESGVGSKSQKEEERRIQEAEELQMNHIPVEEVMARRAELRKARELLFREEVKAKRIKKIKSRSFRRVHRKERERQAEKDQEFFDPENEGMDEDEKERQDRRRAEERMGAKHRESKWAKGMKKSGRTVWDDDARDGVIDMARRNEELRKRIEGKEVRAVEEDSDLDDDPDDESDFDDDEGTDKRRLGKQLDKLSRGDGENTKLGNMAFMQRADAARKAENDAAVEQMRRELAGEESEDKSEAEEETSIGRRIFGPTPTTDDKPKAKVPRGELEEALASDEDDEDEAEIILDRPTTYRPQSVPAKNNRPLLSNGNLTGGKKAAETAPEDDDPWLTAATGTKKSNKKAHSTDYVPKTKVNVSVAPQMTSQPERSKSAKYKSMATESTAPSTNGWTTVPETDGHDDDGNSESDQETSNPILTKQEQQSAYHARAFAGDDVETDFTAEKAVQAADEDEKETSNHLPGWGSWTGSDLTKSERKRNAKAAHNPLFKTRVEGIRPADRKDANLKNVIISEAQQRKSKKYLASQLPHGFEKKEQYESSLRVPVGPEWTTKEVFQRNTKPRVVVKQGVVAPMERPMV